MADESLKLEIMEILDIVSALAHSVDSIDARIASLALAVDRIEVGMSADRQKSKSKFKRPCAFFSALFDILRGRYPCQQ